MQKRWQSAVRVSSCRHAYPQAVLAQCPAANENEDQISAKMNDELKKLQIALAKASMEASAMHLEPI